MVIIFFANYTKRAVKQRFKKVEEPQTTSGFANSEN